MHGEKRLEGNVFNVWGDLSFFFPLFCLFFTALLITINSYFLLRKKKKNWALSVVGGKSDTPITSVTQQGNLGSPQSPFPGGQRP